MNSLIFDTHAHYTDDRFATTSVLQDLQNNKTVLAAITCGVDYADSLNAISLANKYPFIYAAVGIHPQEVNETTVFSESDFLPLIKNKKVVAVGEIGLDYYWDTTHKLAQQEIFAAQLQFANKHNLPVSVHDREAHADTLDILNAHKPKGVVHCFSGSAQMAQQILNLGMYIGVGGVVTFKNAKKLTEVVAATPLERILLETDAPYLAPEPFRGKINHSAYIEYIAEAIAAIKGVSASAVLNQTAQNAKNLFNI
ncbi:MAG: TatD family hydrolase [Clostridia bacterium]|nr:TatD family hydrolase [Clostridia bacterium]